MRRSREDTIETRRRIVEAASRLFRAKGIDAVSVADVMASLGLTAGGFYRHFESKEALAAEAIEAASLETARMHALALPQTSAAEPASDIVDAYLSGFHRTHADRGCPVAALCSEVGHEAASTRKAFTNALERLIATVDQLTPGKGKKRRIRVLQSAASMVGAVALARAITDDALALELLGAVRQGITSSLPRTRRPETTPERGPRSR
jgi:TetR/AcrR family transcriptional repressor of nem operon